MDHDFLHEPLEPSVAELHILDCLEEANGRSLHRRDLVALVKERHRRAGGELKEDEYLYTNTIKKALSNLQKKERVEQAMEKGRWKLTEATNKPKVQPETLQSEKLEPKIIRNGSESIYLFYDEKDQMMASKPIGTRWPCKIGQTKGEVSYRLRSQNSSHFSSQVHALTIKTDNARAFEQILHLLLTLKGRKSTNAQGKEWFETNPEEVVKLFTHAEQTLQSEGLAPIEAEKILRLIVRITESDPKRFNQLTTLLRMAAEV